MSFKRFDSNGKGGIEDVKIRGNVSVRNGGFGA